jgi:hypothetical protein
MVDESVHNDPRDPAEEIFLRMEEQVTHICHNMSFLMVALARKFSPFGEVGDSNLEIGSDGKSRDNEDQEKESWKEPKKE